MAQELTPFKAALAERLTKLGPSEMQENFGVVIGPAGLQEPEDFETLEVEYLVFGEEVGWAIIRRRPDEKSIEWVGFYPMQSVDMGGEVKRGGLGTLAHIATVIELVKAGYCDEEYKIFHSGVIRGGRRGHLAFLGLENPTEPRPIKDYLLKIMEAGKKKEFEFKNPFGD